MGLPRLRADQPVFVEITTASEPILLSGIVTYVSPQRIYVGVADEEHRFCARTYVYRGKDTQIVRLWLTEQEFVEHHNVHNEKSKLREHLTKHVQQMSLEELRALALLLK